MIFLTGLKVNSIINLDHVMAIKVQENKIVAYMEKHHPDCPHVVTLGEYSTREAAKMAFAGLMAQIHDRAYIIGLEDELEGFKDADDGK